MDTKALNCFIALYRLRNMHKAADFIAEGASKFVKYMMDSDLINEVMD